MNDQENISFLKVYEHCLPIKNNNNKLQFRISLKKGGAMD